VEINTNVSALTGFNEFTSVLRASSIICFLHLNTDKVRTQMMRWVGHAAFMGK
jgi:hypothetical protein